MAIGRGGSTIQTKLGFLLYGKPGVWKSSLLLQFLKFKREDGKPFRVLFIDAENGSVDSYLEAYENDGIDLRNIYIIYTQSLSEVNEYIGRAKRNEDFYQFDEDGNESDEIYLDADGLPFRPDAIVVDGVTLLYIAKQQSIVEFSKKRAIVRTAKNEIVGMAKEVAIEGAGLEIKDYNTLKICGQDLILNLLSCGKHFGITCREEDEKISIKDKNGEIKSVNTGRKRPAGFKDVDYNVKTVLYLFEDTDGVVKALVEAKDRTCVHKQGEVLIEPSLRDWEPVIDRNKGRKSFCVPNDLNACIQKERQAIENDNNRLSDEFEQKNNYDYNNDLNTAEDYHRAIKDKISALSSVDRGKKQAEIASVGLPKAYQKIDNLQQLKQFFEIISA